MRILCALVLAAVGTASCARSTPEPAAPSGPPPLAIAVSPTVGEDFAWATLMIARAAMTMPARAFMGNSPLSPNVDLPLRGNWMTQNTTEGGLSVAAALLEEVAAHPEGTCEPSEPAWPPTWHVRIFDRLEGTEGHVARTFDVPVQVVRCRARERIAKHPETRDALAPLAELGEDHIAPDGGAPPPPQRLAPANALDELLAVARGPAGQPRTALLDLSLSDGRGVLIRFADLQDRPEFARADDAHAVAVDDATMRALLLASLSHASIPAGIERSALAYPRSTAHGELRVLQRYAGMRQGILVLAAYLPKADAEAVTRAMTEALAARDASAANMLRLSATYLAAQPRGR